MPTLDFSTLSLQDALDLAILIEDEAKERYEEFAENLSLHHTPDAAGFFVTMAGNEAKHGADLSARRRALFGTAPMRVIMTARQAMEVALESEVKAHDFFDAALAFVHDPDVRTLFEELRAEETEHQDLVKAVMAKLPDHDDAAADFEPDEPVGQ
jgi:rubrerythrin